jgi:sporulation protein YlmC with PRC-barrel domain
MPRARRIEDSKLADLDGKVLGRVDHMLFHPSEPRVVGAGVRPRVFWFFWLKPAYVALADLRFDDKEAVRIKRGKLLRDKKAAEALGADPDKTVIWTGMPVTSRDGLMAGAVDEVWFSLPKGDVTRMKVSGGFAADVAYGRGTIDGAQVVGFDGKAVVVEPRPAEIEVSGSMAKRAAKGAVMLDIAGEMAGRAFVDASRATGKAIRKATRNPVGKARGTWKSMAEAFREGMGEDAHKDR